MKLQSHAVVCRVDDSEPSLPMQQLTKPVLAFTISIPFRREGCVHAVWSREYSPPGNERF